MVSVVIPLYNKQQYIKRAIDSVLAQTYSDFELLIVDDGSTDDSVSVVKSFADSRIRLIRQENKGVSAARNRGIAESDTEWIAFLDADDAWESGFLEKVMSLKEAYPECSVCATAYKHIDRNGNSRELILHGIPFTSSNGLLSNYFEVAAHSNPPFCSISVMIRKSSLLAIGGFPIGIKAGEDLLTWARLAVGNKIAYSLEPLAIFYPERDTYYSRPSRVPDKEDRVGQELERLLKEHPSIIGLNEYVGHWHKMRASIYLRLPHCESECREEIAKALRYPSDSKKLTLYRMLSYLPYSLRMKTFEKLQ